MKNLFVPYDLSVRLKDIGFNEPCFAMWTQGLSEFEWGSSMLPRIFSSKFTLNDTQSCGAYINNPDAAFGIAAPTYEQAFSFLIPLQDEFKVCLDENGWYIYNLEGQTYSSNALEKLLSTVELRKKL